MIPRYIIQHWKKQAPWQTNTQVEHDLILTRALISLYQHPIIRENLAFRGGTALNKIFVNPSARYSEDLDFVLINDLPVGDTMSAIRETLDPWLGQARWSQTKQFVKLNYRFQSEDIPPRPLRLKIEINASEIFTAFGYYKFPLNVNTDWFTGEAELTTYKLDELMATKLRALYQRSKGRDLFDLWLALSQLKSNPNNIVKAFNQYNKMNKENISRAQFEKNLFHKRADETFHTDINTLLPIDYKWDINNAFNTVQQMLITKLQGAPWKNENNK